ncbi:uncharacterized protein LOC118114020 [Hippoglossus stenolepis]|uniref:uncharacterized protein LOC118114020 n=1 Tax=Hippoglossus stenolepis TaxID=195615 RepID=UPI001FAF1E64|nr:uncharacterized protein LOC118114020 [Hippoglossus stenolepis]
MQYIFDLFWSIDEVNVTSLHLSHVTCGTHPTTDGRTCYYIIGGKMRYSFLNTSSLPLQPCGQSQDYIGYLSSPFSDYLVLSIMGEGTYGKVVKCVKTATGEMVAVKIMKKREFTLLTEKEVSTMLILKNYDPDKFNFVKFNSVFVDHEYVCVEYELLDQSLFDFVMKRPTHCLSVKEIRPILHQMATALELLCRIDIVHTDLKSDNIMMVDHINEPFRVKLIDFGLACCVADIESNTPYIQPLAYRAPESMLGLPLTPATDIWSLGCIAAELFLGSQLYPGNCEYDMLQLITQTQCQIPERLLKVAQDTRWFFSKRKEGGARKRWILKSPEEMGVRTRIKSQFQSLDSLISVRPVCHLSEEDTMAELEDRQLFANLLKRMLRLDYGNRITPSQIFQDPFMTMNYIEEKYPDSFYVKLSFELMEVCRTKPVQPVQPPWSNLQASTSLGECNTSNSVIPAWHFHREHPFVQQLAFDFSNSLLLDDHMPRCQQSGSQSAHPRKRKDRSPDTDLPALKRMKLDCIEENTQILLLPDTPAGDTSNLDHNPRKRTTSSEDIGLPEEKTGRIYEPEVDTQTVLLPDTPAEATSRSDYNPRKRKTRTQDICLPDAKRRRIYEPEVDTQTVLPPNAPAEDTSSFDHNPRKRKTRTEDICLPDAKRRRIYEPEVDTQTDLLQNVPAVASCSYHKPMERNTQNKRRKQLKKKMRKKPRRIVEETETETLPNYPQGSWTVDTWPECSFQRSKRDRKRHHLDKPKKSEKKRRREKRVTWKGLSGTSPTEQTETPTKRD